MDDGTGLVESAGGASAPRRRPAASAPPALRPAHRHYQKPAQLQRSRDDGIEVVTDVGGVASFNGVRGSLRVGIGSVLFEVLMHIPTTSLGSQ